MNMLEHKASLLKQGKISASLEKKKNKMTEKYEAQLEKYRESVANDEAGKGSKT